MPCHDTRARAFTLFPEIPWRVTFVGTLPASPTPLNVGLRDPIKRMARNNIGWGGVAREHLNLFPKEVSQLIMSGSVGMLCRYNLIVVCFCFQ